MPLFGPPDVKKLRAKGNVKSLIKALSYKEDWRVRQAAADALEQFKDSISVEPLIEALRDEFTQVRISALITLAKIGDLRAVPPMITKLIDENVNVRESAKKALIKIGGSQTVEALVGILGDDTEYSTKQELAAEILGQIGDEGVIEHLIFELNDMSEDVQNAVANALEQLNWVPTDDEKGAQFWIIKGDWEKCVDIGITAIHPLINVLENDYWKDHRVSAAEALGKISDPLTVKPLITALKDEDGFVQIASAKALGEIGDKRAIKPLIATLKEQDVLLRETVVESLSKIGASAEKTVLPLLKNRDVSIRPLGVEILGNIGGDHSIEPLILAMKDDELRDLAQDALVKIGAPALELLINALENQDKEVRISTVQLLSKIGNEKAIKPLMNLLKDEDEDIRKVSAIAIGRIGDPSSLEPLILLLQTDDNVKFRLQIIKVIGQLKNERAVEPLISMLKSEDYDTVRSQIIKVLGQLKDERAITPLIELFDEGNEELFPSIARAFGQLGDIRALDILIGMVIVEGWDTTTREAIIALGHIGDIRAIEPLIKVLMIDKKENRKLRKDVAKALVRIYKNELLEPENKKRILEFRSIITEKHQDGNFHNHTDIDHSKGGRCLAGHEDRGDHIDKGLEVNFPL